MRSIEKLIRQDLRDIKPYPVYYPQNDELISLDKNELPWDCEVPALGRNRYPLPNQRQLLAQLAQYYQVEPSQMILTRGSDDGIDVLIRLFCSPFQDAIMISSPTFVMYQVSAKLQGAKVIDIPLNSHDFSFDIDSMTQKLTPDTKIIFVCSPNNPTGTQVPYSDIIALCQKVANQAIVVVDEAYIEFASRPSMSAFLGQCANLVVLRTFSKAFGLAGIRCGVVLACPVIINYLQAVLPPYPLSSNTLEAVSMAMQTDYLRQVKEYIRISIEQKKILIESLEKLHFVEKIYSSEANFILVKFYDANSIFEQCAKQKVILKSFKGQPLLDNCLRLSVGRPRQNKKLIQLLTLLSVKP